MKLSLAPTKRPFCRAARSAAHGAGVQFVGANWFRHRPTVPSCMPRMVVGLVKTTHRKHQKPTTKLSATLVTSSTSLRAWPKRTQFLLGLPSLRRSQPDNTVSGSRLSRMVEADGCAGYQPATPKKHVIQQGGVKRWTRVQLPARPPTFATVPIHGMRVMKRDSLPADDAERNRVGGIHFSAGPGQSRGHRGDCWGLLILI